MPCLYGNMRLECAEFIAFQIFMLYSPSPPKILISSCQPPPSLSSVSHPSAIATFIFLSFLFYHSFFIALSISSILLPSPSTPFLFDVSLILPRLSTLVISSIFHRYPSSLLAHLSHFLCPPFLPTVSILFFQHYALSTSKSFSPFLLPTPLFRIYNLSHFLASSISHWPCILPFPSPHSFPSVPRVLVKGRYEPTNGTQLTAKHNEFLKMTLIYKIIFKKIY